MLCAETQQVSWSRLCVHVEQMLQIQQGNAVCFPVVAFRERGRIMCRMTTVIGIQAACLAIGRSLTTIYLSYGSVWLLLWRRSVTAVYNHVS